MNIEEMKQALDALAEQQEPDDLTIAYMTGFHAGKNKYAPRREWVGLTEEQYRDCAQAMDAEPLAEGWTELLKFAKSIEDKLREKNGC